jgi:hypothetical protein
MCASTMSVASWFLIAWSSRCSVRFTFSPCCSSLSIARWNYKKTVIWIISSFFSAYIIKFIIKLKLMLTWFRILFTEKNGDRMQSPFIKTVNDRILVRLPPYLSVYDTEIYDRNTITCKLSCFFVCGRLRPCFFELGGNYQIILNF